MADRDMKTTNSQTIFPFSYKMFGIASGNILSFRDSMVYNLDNIFKNNFSVHVHIMNAINGRTDVMII